MLIVVVIIAIMVQRDAVELEEGVCYLVSGSRKATVQRHALHRSRSADINAFTLLNVTEVGCFVASQRMRDDRRLHMANKGPLSATEEWVCLDVRCSGTST